ncbi:DUF1294 domain-containing protein [Methanolapillus millepedarum]|uniref:DUF1294 domain-containing protein n=1 Tax=Methanolapillus millepedarum TaxID=3028296 RepID=A0AA96V362_9EURY|nr:hypothetical protein MsAc7_05180 [Methanosarcinaceae archaeon Ac7]
MDNLYILLIIYVLLNVIAFAAYGFDKRKAQTAKWRTPEATLLFLAFLGPFGAYAGMQIFRHKTQKKPFTWMVPLFMVIHLIVLAVLIFI